MVLIRSSRTLRIVSQQIRSTMPTRPSSAGLQHYARSLSSTAQHYDVHHLNYTYDPVSHMMQQASNLDILSSPEVQQILAEQRLSQQERHTKTTDLFTTATPHNNNNNNNNFHHPAACGSPDPYLSDCEEMRSSWTDEARVEDCDSLDAKRML